MEYGRQQTGAQSWQTYRVATFRLDSNNQCSQRILNRIRCDVLVNAGSNRQWIRMVEQHRYRRLWRSNTGLELYDNKFYAVDLRSISHHFFYEGT